MKTRKQQQRVIDSDALAEAMAFAKGDQSWRDVAAQVGIGHMTFKRIMLDQRVPDIDNYVRLCRWLGVPIGTFVKDKWWKNAS